MKSRGLVQNLPADMVKIQRLDASSHEADFQVEGRGWYANAVGK